MTEIYHAILESSGVMKYVPLGKVVSCDNPSSYAAL